MLYYTTIEANTLSILKRLLNLPQLNSFNLAGGTALALKFGHRISVDIDLFGENFDRDELIKALQSKFPNQMLLISIPQALCYFDKADQSENPISLKE